MAESAAVNDIDIQRTSKYWIVRFTAMAGPCEVFVDCDQEQKAIEVAEIAIHEAKRIEHKFSRYRTDNIVYKINKANGKSIDIDQETAHLLAYAEKCYQISDGLFDITSGILRSAWKFKGQQQLPTQSDINSLLKHVGWQKLVWQQPTLTLPTGMEIDFGGIGKEYAVDRTVRILQAHTRTNFIVNYGGDLYVTGPHTDGSGWRVGLDDPGHTGERARATIELNHGGVATSGDARRFLLRDGIRYSHILDPHTGWPVKNAPRAVTVVASTCIEAGMLATFAMLQGENAEPFLQQQGVKFWCY